jgi:hypothetical protein
MRLLGNIVAVVVLLIGIVWTLQGANVIGGSVMSGHPQWLYTGIVLLIVGVGALWWANSRRVPRA